MEKVVTSLFCWIYVERGRVKAECAKEGIVNSLFPFSKSIFISISSKMYNYILFFLKKWVKCFGRRQKKRTFASENLARA